jgi:hypothetical protein
VTGVAALGERVVRLLDTPALLAATGILAPALGERGGDGRDRGGLSTAPPG